MQGRINVVRFCEVLSIDDDTDADRIKVRLEPEDNSKTIDEIDYAFPLLPKMFHIKPKVGEAVFVFLATTNDGNSQRYYIGPVISQDHKLYNDPYFYGADSFLRGAYKKFDVAPRMKPDFNGLLPKDDDIVIRGRKNAELQISENDITIKSGVKIVDEAKQSKAYFNEKNPSFIKTKYHLNPLTNNTYSTTSIVSDKILLLSNTSPNYFKTTDRDNLISDETYNEIIEKAYRLPYGELLVDFLNTFVTAFIEHTHPFSMLPPNPYFTSDLISKKNTMLDRQDMLSDTVRIN